MEFPDAEVARLATYITGHPDTQPDARHLAATRALLGGLAAEGLLVLPTIRAIERGDYDEQMRMRIIGPFPTAEARDDELYRLRALPGMRECFWLWQSVIPPAAAEQTVSAAESVELTGVDGLFEAFTNS